MELANHECIGHCEFDKFAEASYRSMHTITEEQRTRLETMTKRERQKEILRSEYLNGEWYAQDVRTVRAANMPVADCWTFGAPCQDFSIAGKRAGLKGDRSSLVREIFRILEETEEKNKPTWLIYENVKGMLSSNRGLDFLSILSEMDRLGYDAEWQIVNSRWFVPQNRERVYVVGHYRGRSGKQVFPIKGAGGENRLEFVGGVYSEKDGRLRNSYRTYHSRGLAPCINTSGGGNLEPHVCFGVDMSRGAKERVIANALMTKDRGVANRPGEGTAVAIKVKEATKQGYAIADVGDSINLSVPSSKTRRGRVGDNIANTLDTSCNQGVVTPTKGTKGIYAVWSDKYNSYLAIRKLTPRECFRLQGWTDDYFERAEFMNSSNQLYKQAGNGVTVNVVQAIGEKI